MFWFSVYISVKSKKKKNRSNIEILCLLHFLIEGYNEQSGTKPKIVAKVLATNFGNHL